LRLTPAELRLALAGYVPRRRPAGSLRRAAVLVPILVSPGAGPEVLFLVRPTTLTSHSGQVAFPGGHIDPGDASPAAAALREAEEELGIARGRPEIIGELDDMNTHTGFHVTPIVALIETPLVLVPSPAEVASHFKVPLARLADPAERRTIRGLNRPDAARAGSELRLYFWVRTPATIWGVTGHILTNLLSVIAEVR